MKTYTRNLLSLIFNRLFLLEFAFRGESPIFENENSFLHLPKNSCATLKSKKSFLRLKKSFLYIYLPSDVRWFHVTQRQSPYAPYY